MRALNLAPFSYFAPPYLLTLLNWSSSIGIKTDTDSQRYEIANLIRDRGKCVLHMPSGDLITCQLIDSAANLRLTGELSYQTAKLSLLPFVDTCHGIAEAKSHYIVDCKMTYIIWAKSSFRSLLP